MKKRLPSLIAITLLVIIYNLFTRTPKGSFDRFYEFIEVHSGKTEREHLTEIVNKYIAEKAPDSKISGKYLVECCYHFDIDIKLVLAQAQIESLFGTKGVARKTNSVWNVKAYDNRSAQEMISKGHGYDDPNKSIIPYLSLLSNNYLVEGRTETDLLENFTDKWGRRYASDEEYERKLKRTYKNISRFIEDE